MEKTNIERFDEISAAILAYLYSAFPIPTVVLPRVAGLSEVEVISHDPVEEISVTVGERDPETEFFEATLAWLVQSGFVLRKDNGHFASTYVLTSFGLQALKHVPQPSLNRETLGEKLAAATKDGATGMIKETVNQVISVGVQILARSVGLAPN